MISSVMLLLPFYSSGRSDSASNTLTVSSFIAIASFVWLAYLVGLGVYRLYFSPLANFPGPKLAALTTWYQGYYDIWLRGQYIWRVKEMHMQYGPIVRINPHEIHINDPEYVDEVYMGVSKKRDKYRWVTRLGSLGNSMVGTISHDLHRKRRAPLGPFFSKQSVRRLEPIVQDRLVKLLERMSSSEGTGQPFPLTLAYHALTCDIITEYAFGESTRYLDRDDYNVAYWDANAKLWEMGHLMMHVSWLSSLTELLPKSLMARLSPGLASLKMMQQNWETQIRRIKESLEHGDAGKDTSSIFHGLLTSDLPESEKTVTRLRSEAHLIVVAGQDTTALTLSAITYHLLANPVILGKLKAELEAALPDPNMPPTVSQVEHLPYLTAVIQEGLRLHPGATNRLARVSPHEPLCYEDGQNRKWVIPAGTPISMTSTLLHTIPEIFPDPQEFRPERWLANPRLDRYLMTFSKGPRMCLGINLAYQELYLVLAGIFRRYDLHDEKQKK